jgi:hypothetical protein
VKQWFQPDLCKTDMTPQNVDAICEPPPVYWQARTTCLLIS